MDSILENNELDDYINRREIPIRRSGVFKLIRIKCSFFSQEAIIFDFGQPLDANQSKGGYYSLLLGKNGTCKSSLLRELIEFFIDSRKPYPRKRKTHISIESVEYVIDEHLYRIEKPYNEYLHFKNNDRVDKDQMTYPLIIASTMGMFDKFPVNSNSNTYKGRFDWNYYHYVGPKASNNMFTSKPNVLLQQLSALRTINKKNQLIILDVILKFIGYDSKIEFRFNSKYSRDDFDTFKRDKIDDSAHRLLINIIYENVHSIAIVPSDASLKGIKDLPIPELNQLRQNGFLKDFKCILYKKGKEVDATFLSSGEFNLLCIVTSVVLAAESQHLLLLLDEPEISQHPNWQLDLIPNLEKSLVDFSCHFLIATHCHFLVSNLPIGRSNVICMFRDSDDKISVDNIQSETFGWSSEEVLLKAFSVPTDRNRYLAEIVGDFLKAIGEKKIDRDETISKIMYFKEISQNLSNYDPMKKILETIICEFTQ